jgi:peptidyl-prolyl cis-trans isomerase C
MKKMKTYLLTTLFIGTAILLSACNAKEAEEPQQEVDLTAMNDLFEEPVKKPSAGPNADEVMITVNGTEITAGEIQAQVNALLNRMQGQVDPQMLPQLANQVVQQVQDQLIMQELLTQKVAETGIRVESSEVDQVLNQIKTGIPEGESLEDSLAENGTTLEELKADITKDLQINKLIEAQVADIAAATDEEAAKFYAENPERFVQPERIKASHILIKFDEEETDETKAAKKAQIEAIKKRLDAGEDFAELAKTESDCPSAERGGDLGMFVREQMVPEFSDAAFALETNTVSDVVETQYGYHLIKASEKTPETVIALEDVQDRLKNMLSNNKKREAVAEYMKQLREAADVEFKTPAGAESAVKAAVDTTETSAE